MTMKHERHVALLRGINVGGNNVIKMADLRATFANMNFADVVTYIQSGNVVFSAKAADKPKLVEKIERALRERFGYGSRVVVISHEELAAVVARAPAGFGEQPDKYRHDVLFVKAPLTCAGLLELIPRNPAVDQVFGGKHAVYFRRLTSKATQSHLPKLVRLPVYQNITMRNWNTTIKLLEICEN
jgi:uncharacterized protein (DUF1697 family)